MNCRRTRSLLSAYIDRELTGSEMLDIRDHVTRCVDCRDEHESLLAIKRMLSALPDKEPNKALLWKIEQATSRTRFEAALLDIQSNSWFSQPVSFTTGKRFASACALSLLGMMFIVAPSARTSQSETPSDRQSPMTPGNSRSGLGSAGMLGYSELIDPIQKPVQVSDIQNQLLQMSALNNARRRYSRWMSEPSLPGSFTSVSSQPQTLSVPGLVYTGYSVVQH